MEKFDYWMAEFGAPEIFAKDESMRLGYIRLMNAQKDLKSLAQKLMNAGVKPDDPVKVSVLVEMMAVTGELHSAEFQFATAAILREIRAAGEKK